MAAIAKVSCSIRASSDVGANKDAAAADDNADTGAASMTARAELTAITLPSIPTLRANDSMNKLRMRSFMMLAFNAASDKCNADDADDGDFDADNDGGGVDRMSKSPSVMAESVATDDPGDAAPLLLLPLMLAA